MALARATFALIFLKQGLHKANQALQREAGVPYPHQVLEQVVVFSLARSLVKEDVAVGPLHLKDYHNM